jgi:hypothetical protein
MINEVEYKREWVIGLSFDNINYVVAWELVTSLRYGNSEHYLNIYKIVDGVEVNLDDSEPAREPVLAASRAFRKEQIKKEIDKSSLWFNEEKTKDLIMVIINRAFDGEYMGQYRNEHLYTMDVLDLFEQTLISPLNEVFRTLIEEKRVGLNGNIFIPYEQYEQNRAYAFESSGGHRDFHVNDYGDWNCNYCGNSSFDGQPNTDPRTVLCVKQ